MGHGSKEVVVIWRGVQLKVDINVNSSIKEFALKLLDLTQVKAETMKLLVPAPADHGSKLLTPFSAQHSELSMEEAAILTGKPIIMMGAFEDEVEEVSHNNLKSELRIIGFDEEETRMKQRVSNGISLLKLPKGNYIFCDFRTLSLPGIELNPPPSEALKRMHMLACDPGIIAIMNKHRWRVGIMTEMAPVGYVGISPKCLLGFNMNHGEEISLRLRTDDLKGFRKYESIKKTLLHELAHMVYSEHDADFLALNKQLNEEAETLNWTRSRSYTLNGKRFSNIDENEFHLDTPSIQYTGQKVGGTIPSASAREASVAAAYSRVMNSFTSDRNETEVKSSNGNHLEKSRQIASTKQGDGTMIVDKKDAKSDPDDAPVQHPMQIDPPKHHASVTLDNKKLLEPDPDKFPVSVAMPYEEPDPDDILLKDLQIVPVKELELNPDDSQYVGIATKVEQGYFADGSDVGVTVDIQGFTDPDFNVLRKNGSGILEPDADDRMRETGNPEQQGNASVAEPDPDDRMEEAQNQEYLRVEPVIEPDPDDSMGASMDEELQRIEDPAAAICRRIQKAIEMLRSEAPPVDAASSLQTLFKIIRNVTDYPNDAKFRRLRKSNPSFKKNVASYKAAMDLLAIVGFYEDVVIDEVGRSETYMVLRRDDPGLLWLAKSSLEVSIA